VRQLNQISMVSATIDAVDLCRSGRIVRSHQRAEDRGELGVAVDAGAP
jgi:hypothetical protein